MAKQKYRGLDKRMKNPDSSGGCRFNGVSAVCLTSQSCAKNGRGFQRVKMLNGTISDVSSGDHLKSREN